MIAGAGMALIVALGVLTTLAWFHYRDTAGTQGTQGVASSAAAAPAALTGATPATPARREVVPRQPAARLPGLMLRATRGESWVSVHLESASGASLFEGVLPQGKSVHFSKRKLWLRLGAPENLDAKVNGRRATLPTVTSTIFLDGDRITTLATG